MLRTRERDIELTPRLLVVLLAALAVSLPMAWISLSKVLLFLTGLGYLIANLYSRYYRFKFDSLWTTRITLTIILAFTLSLWWTTVDISFALLTFVKHAKLLEILLIIFLIKNEREARLAIKVFTAGQIFIVLCSWLLACGISLPWVINSQVHSGTKYVVFAESYLDQSIMLASTAAVLWHLRCNQYWPRWLSYLIAVAAIINIFLLLPGRTGYLIALTMMSLAAMWAMQKRWRLPILIAIPLIAVVALHFSQGRLHDRAFQVANEAHAYSQQTETNTSSGWRLNAWHRSLQAIQESPWNGYGVGSWAPTVKRLEGNTGVEVFGNSNSSNPHQEYLLWGVELGVGGIALLLALLVGVAWDIRKFDTSIYRATLSILVTIAIASLFNSALFDDLMGDFLCVSLGLLMALGLHSKVSIQPSPC